MQKIFLSLLAFFARLIILVKRPYVIGVTGTVGKTTISRWIATLLAEEYGKENVMASEYNYNGEFGLPLTIIHARSPGRNIFGWLHVFGIAIMRLVRPYPKYLVLEYGIDHPGEMDFLLSIVEPDIAILTEVTPAHIEQFGTFDVYLHAKISLILHAKQAIVHEKMRDLISRDAMYYGVGALSYIDVSGIQLFPDRSEFTLHIGKTDLPILLPFSGEHQVVNLLPLFGVAEILHIPYEHVTRAIPNLTLGGGRGAIFSGLGNSEILDGSYNAGYRSLSEGICFLSNFTESHDIILFLGDMRELGETLTEKFHHAIAQEIIQYAESEKKFARIVLVGPLMRDFIFPLLQAANIPAESFQTSPEAGESIHSFLLKPHTKPLLVYVKGSQNTIFLEEGIKKFLADPSDASRLCRQSSDWIKKKDEYFRSVADLRG